MMTPHQHATGTSPTERGPQGTGPEPLPDLLGLTLAELRRLRHPALSAMLDELRDRVVGAEETVWENGPNDPPPPVSSRGRSR